MMSPDVQREVDLETARRVVEDYLEDQTLTSLIRQDVERARCISESYGARMTTNEFVFETLEALARRLKARALSPSDA